jgi:hypothetical protein
MNNNVAQVYATVLALLIVGGGLAIAQKSPDKSDSEVEVFRGKGAESSNIQESNSNQRTLRLTITVDSPEFLKVAQGDVIAKGKVLADNTNERNRLKKQKQSVVLQINNLESKKIPEIFKPKTIQEKLSLPAANFLEENAAISEAQFELQQAKEVLQLRLPTLKADNPEIRSQAEKAESVLRSALKKVSEQEELLKAVQDMKLGGSVKRHEEAKLQQLSAEAEQAESVLEQEKSKLAASAIEQQFQIKNLQIAVQRAEAKLQTAVSRLNTARNNRQLLEYKAQVELAQRREQENQSQQQYSQQQQQQAEAIRNKEYQLAQLKLSLASIEDKLSQIPVVRSPKAGYIRRVKPWVGANGKYTTVLTISSGDNLGNFLRGNKPQGDNGDSKGQ